MISLYPGLVALTNNQTIVFILAALAGIFQAGIDLVFFDELMKTIPPRYSPTFVSLAQSITYLAAILAPLVGTYLSVQIGLTGALLVSALIRFIGFILFYRQSSSNKDLHPNSTSAPSGKITQG
jgi:predicted MFS family arabinose efflux permease